MPDAPSPPVTPPPDGVTGVLALADGTHFYGQGVGAQGSAVGEVCFTTSMTGYQETLTDPSYAGQIITFTFPHIGNTGTNSDDIETINPTARGLVLRAAITDPANFRAEKHLDDWLKSHNLIGIAGVDTRRLTRHIRVAGAPNGVVAHDAEGRFDIPALIAEARAWPGLKGMDLAKEVTCLQSYTWEESLWSLGSGYGRLADAKAHVVAIDYGIKRNILRCLASVGAKVTVVPATATAEEVMAHKPDGIFLSNGPGDPAATGDYAIPMLKDLIGTGTPIFGICLGHQLLALALGAETSKMHQGHRGANHPVKELATGKVEVTTMNHGFTVNDTLPDTLEVTHISLFDGSICGLKVKDKPIFSVQHHPEASPGPQDSHYLFERFMGIVTG